jgi:hypothetical protein
MFFLSNQEEPEAPTVNLFKKKETRVYKRPNPEQHKKATPYPD